MKHVLFYVATAVVLIAVAMVVKAKFFSVKEQAPAYVWGKGRGIGTDFMDSSKAQAGITPVKGNLEVSTAKPIIRNAWAGKVLAIQSTVPTGNPVRTQNKTIWS